MPDGGATPELPSAELRLDALETVARSREREGFDVTAVNTRTLLALVASARRLATAEQRLEAAEAVAQWTLDNFTNASVVPLLHAWEDLRQPTLPTADDVKGIL